MSLDTPTSGVGSMRGGQDKQEVPGTSPEPPIG
jgi:hypothetical protein